MKSRWIALPLSLLCAAMACDEGGTSASPAVDAATSADVTADVVRSPPDTSAPADVSPPCNAILQTGCSEGENCTYATNATAPSCQPGGDKLYGQQCSGQGDCAEGTCIDLNGTGSYCYKFCKTELHCSGVAPGPGGKAFKGPCLDLTDSPYKVCELDVDYETCNLLSQDCEDSTKGCYVSSGEPAPVCLPAGTAPVGGGCQGVSDCAPGGTCVNTKCYKLCASESDCETTFAQCSSYFGAVGICEEQ